MSFRYQLLIAFLLSLQTKMRDDLNFDDLFRLYYDSLFRFARQFINDDEDCHDIVSNAYEDELEKQNQKMEEKMNRMEKELNVNAEKKSGNFELPPEIQQKFENLKKSMLTNIEK